MKKFILLFITLIITCLSYKTEAQASTLTYDFTGWYYGKSRDGITTFSSYYLRNYVIDGNIAYCVEPLLEEGTDQYIIGKWEDLGFNNDIKEKVLLYAYYGYQYPGHQTLRYRAATQALIWEAIGDGYSIIFNTKLWNKGDIISVDKEKEEIKKLVKHHYDKPSFDKKNYKALVGQTITLEDTNKVLTNYSLGESRFTDIGIKNNSIKVTPLKAGKLTINFTKKQIYSKPYIVYYADGYQNLLAGGNVDKVLSSFTIEAENSQVEIYKKDSKTSTPQGLATLEGAVYQIYNKDGVIMAKLTTDKNGYAISSKTIPCGSYYIKEISPSKGYNLDPNKHYFEVTKEKETIYLEEDIIKGSINIKKIDNETNSCSPNLQGAEYSIYNSKNNLVDTLIIGDNCEAISKQLPYDDYIIKETKSSLGYNLDTNIYNASIISNKTMEIISTEEIIKNEIHISKKYDIGDNNTENFVGESNIVFNIYDTNNILHKSISTDSDGNATIILPYGLWLFHQENVPAGYKKCQDFIINVDNNSSIIQTYNIINERLKAYLKINKIDSETKELIINDNAAFKILNTDTNTYVTETINNKEINEFNTKDGYLITNIPLKSGNYKLIETKSPYGYFINSKEIDFQISEETKFNHENDFIYIEINVENNPIKGKLILNKIDENNNPIANTEFEIYDSSNNVIYNGLTNYEGQLIVDNLPIGIYFIKEKNAAIGFVNNNEITSFEINEQNRVIHKSFINNHEIIDVPYTYQDDYNYQILIIYIGFIYYEIKKKINN